MQRNRTIVPRRWSQKEKRRDAELFVYIQISVESAVYITYVCSSLSTVYRRTGIVLFSTVNQYRPVFCHPEAFCSYAKIKQSLDLIMQWKNALCWRLRR